MGRGHVRLVPKINAILLITFGAFLVSASTYYCSLTVHALDVAMGVANAVGMLTWNTTTPPTSWEKAQVVGPFAIPLLAGVHVFYRGVRKLRQQNRMERH